MVSLSYQSRRWQVGAIEEAGRPYAPYGVQRQARRELGFPRNPLCDAPDPNQDALAPVWDEIARQRLV